MFFFVFFLFFFENRLSHGSLKMFWLQYFANCRLFNVKMVGIREALLHLVVGRQRILKISTNHGLNAQYVN